MIHTKTLQTSKDILKAETKMHDIIIIGGGPSGMTAALYALRANKSVLILEKENFGGQIANSPKVENYPTIKEISGSDLTDRMVSQIMDMGAEFELEDATKIEKIGDIFKVSTNYNVHECKAVIIANGVKHRTLGLPNEEELIGKGVYYCAVCDGPMYKGKEVYLIGDANTALQYAVLLSGYCTKVHMFCLFDHFFGDPILQDRVRSRENVEVTFNMNLVEYKGENHLEGLVFENTQTHEKFEFSTDNVFVSVGQIPDNEKFKDVVELDKGFIITDEDMNTKTPGVFACGDTRKKAIKQVVTACNDGAIAAMSAVKYLN